MLQERSGQGVTQDRLQNGKVAEPALDSRITAEYQIEPFRAVPAGSKSALPCTHQPTCRARMCTLDASSLASAIADQQEGSGLVWL